MPSLPVSLALSLAAFSTDRLTNSLEIPTFLIAGHETTSTALAWTLFGLSSNLEAQRRLREELLALNTDSPTMDDLKMLKYLDMVVRESLRLWSPISSSKRVAVKDVLLPLRDGRVVKLNEGDEVRIPIHPMNTAKGVWGEDAAEFKYAVFPVSQVRGLIAPFFSFSQSGPMEVDPRSRDGDPWYLGKPNDVYGWFSSLHWVPVRRL